MKYCKRVGIDVTKRCQAKCQTCFYRYKPDFNTKYDKPLDQVKKELDKAKEHGCEHLIVVGWGEPGLYPHLFDTIKYS